MTTFEIHLNRAPDLFRRAWNTPAILPGDRLEFVHGGIVVTNESEAELLAKIFEIYNIDHPVGYNERSLSVGDVVIINGRWFVCEIRGWTRTAPRQVEYVPSDDLIDLRSSEMDAGVFEDPRIDIERYDDPDPYGVRDFCPDYPDDLPF